MRIPRIYTPQPLHLNDTISLDDNAANHVARVLRITTGRLLFIFNGETQCHFEAEIIECQRKRVSLKLIKKINTQLESPLNIHLGQAISKGDRFEFVIQKATELGINEITPLWTEHCDVKLSPERLEKKLKQWQQIAIAACEQSGRDIVPSIHQPEKVQDWLVKTEAQEKWVLDPRGKVQSSDEKTITSACLLIGPEGGLSNQEVESACQQNFKSKLIGPRILRTETAALTAITLLQHQWGDF